MNEINNLGLFSEIHDVQLRNKIHDYYMFIDFHFSDLNIQKVSDRDIEFHDYLRDNFGVSSRDDFDDPIEFIKNNEGIILRLKEVRNSTNRHCLQVVKAINMAHEIIEMIEL